MPEGSTLIWVADGAREAVSIEGEGQLRWEGEVRGWLNLEIRTGNGELHTLGNPVFAERCPA